MQCDDEYKKTRYSTIQENLGAFPEEDGRGSTQETF